MIPDKILYTDGHDVTVTDSTFQVKNTSYSLKGIIKHGLLILKPHRLPGILLLTIGLLLCICGVLGLIPASSVPDTNFNGTYVSANSLAIWIGGALALIGLLVTGLIRERYAVRIATAEGEKNAVVSTRKEYITQIVNALNEGLRFSQPTTSRPFITIKD
jgi:hypothetical protein